jgi:hypothetical protein
MGLSSNCYEELHRWFHIDLEVWQHYHLTNSSISCSLQLQLHLSSSSVGDCLSVEWWYCLADTIQVECKADDHLKLESPLFLDLSSNWSCSWMMMVSICLIALRFGWVKLFLRFGWVKLFLRLSDLSAVIVWIIERVTIFGIKPSR